MGQKEVNLKKTGKFIARIREERNLTQSELAQKLGVSNKAISKWECGRGLPEIGMLIPLSEELGISIKELLLGERMAKEVEE